MGYIVICNDGLPKKKKKKGRKKDGKCSLELMEGLIACFVPYQLCGTFLEK